MMKEVEIDSISEDEDNPTEVEVEIDEEGIEEGDTVELSDVLIQGMENDEADVDTSERIMLPGMERQFRRRGCFVSFTQLVETGNLRLRSQNTCFFRRVPGFQGAAFPVTRNEFGRRVVRLRASQRGCNQAVCLVRVIIRILRIIRGPRRSRRPVPSN